MERVLQVVTHMNRGGLETMLMNYYRHMDRSQVQFDFLTHREYDGDYGEEIKALGGKIFHLPVLNPLSGSYKSELDKFFKEHKEYKVVHVHQDCLSSVILKAAKANGVPTRIAHSHNKAQDKNLKFVLKAHYMKSIPEYSTKLFACGKEAGDWMFGGAPYDILNNAIDVRDYTFNAEKRKAVRAELGLSDADKVVGHVGRFCPQKNHTFILDIFKEVLEEEENAKLLLVGDGELRNDIEAKINALGMEDKVILTGVRSDVPDLMQAMDLFLFPSNYEGLPVTMVEAQSSGLPCIISTNVPIECKMTELVEQMALEEGAKKWANEVCASFAVVRPDTYEEIKANGFDIVENAAKLQKFYLDAAKGE